MAMLVAPFLINCAIATGDPFYAINNHTDFYLKREGAADVTPISAVSYSLEQIRIAADRRTRQRRARGLRVSVQQ